MSFHFKVDLGFDFPRPPPRNSTDQTTSASNQNQDSNEPIKPGLTGWIQTARQHHYYHLRLLYLIVCVAGLIVNSIVVNSIWTYRIQDTVSTAWALLSAGLAWQLANLLSPRLFQGRQIPNWVVAIVETLGFGGFVALVVMGNLAVQDDESLVRDKGDYYYRYHYENTMGLVNVTKMAYDEAVWILLGVLNAILAIKCYIQGVRNLRSPRAKCSDCEHPRAGVQNNDSGEAEEPLMREGEAEGEAGPSEGAPQAPYRDEPEIEQTA